MRPPRTVRFAPRAEPELAARARALAAPAAAGEEGASRALVAFTLAGARYAVELGLVERVVARLGLAAPLAGAPAGLCGLAFIDGMPHLLVDFLEQLTHRTRSLEQLALAPALVLQADTGALALCVEGPLELVDAPRLLAGDGAPATSALGLSGRLPDGTLVLTSAWVLEWAASLRGGRDG